MPKLYLIDHSLKGVGGHHFEYAVQVLEAAERAGYEPILAVSEYLGCRIRRFQRRFEEKYAIDIDELCRGDWSGIVFGEFGPTSNLPTVNRISSAGSRITCFIRPMSSHAS